MKIIFYVDGMAFNGETISSGKSLGGSESAGYYIAHEMHELGHDVMVFSNGAPGVWDGVQYQQIGEKSKEYPFGIIFTQYTCSVPFDILIGQRIPSLFTLPVCSKLNYFWTHDLALMRYRKEIESQLWNVTRVLAVSDFHKDQIAATYGIKEGRINLLRNGVDKDHYTGLTIDPVRKFESKQLVFSSRPERGLENLVKVGGVMEKLFKEDPEINLTVCTYDHFHNDMKAFYEQLWKRCQELPNVSLCPPQSKQTLAQIESNACLQVYPTDFEETSCITAMNTQTAGTPFVASQFGALSETLDEGGVSWVEKTDEGGVSIDGFVTSILELIRDKSKWHKLHKSALKKSPCYDWTQSALDLDQVIEEDLARGQDNQDTVANSLLYNSDVIACREYAEKYINDKELKAYYLGFIKDNYKSLNKDGFKGFYDDIANYNIETIKNTHMLGDDAFQLSMPRIEAILATLRSLPKGSKVLDYGCCVGQVTIAYARTFPHLYFTGVDIVQSQIDIAVKYATEQDVKNVKFARVDSPVEVNERDFDLVLASEVMEHVPDYLTFLKQLESKVKEGSQCVVTVPSGPVEELRWNVQKTREHLHHFTESDIKEIFKNKTGVTADYRAVDKNAYGEVLGSFTIKWSRDSNAFQLVDYQRKFKRVIPKQTLSVCIIVGAYEGALERTIQTVQLIADEIIIALDGESENITRIAEQYGAKLFSTMSPRKIGFDKVRNATIDRATKDWVLWIDADELLQWPENISKYLRQNQYDSYAIHQHHFSAEPAGLIKTDTPCRLFRNRVGIQFFGLVHEHPEFELNKGAGHTYMIPQGDVSIMHFGYENEKVRRERFLRNWPLMKLDRKIYPERELGKMLWIRDLSHMNRFEYEKVKVITPEMDLRAKEAIKVWRELTKLKKFRLIQESAQYYNESVDFLTRGKNITYQFDIRVSNAGFGDNLTDKREPMVLKFQTEEEIREFALFFLTERFEVLKCKYI